MLDIITGDITKNEGILIKPEASKVSKFCTQLTTITQEMLDKEGISFKEACDVLRTEYSAYQYTWASYGAYDYNMLEKQCSFRKMDFPVSKNHINVKELFTEKKCKNAGMNDFVSKPFNETELIRKITTLLELNFKATEDP